ncbi:MAG: agmatinase family protein [bacterium]|nr:agmatinase family protein [bacterium]
MKTLETRLNEVTGTGVGLIGFPLDLNSSFLTGAATAPPLIRKALHSSATNLWTESGLDIGAADLHDLGDLPLVGVDDPLAKIEQAMGLLLSRQFIPLGLGGDHSITWPIVRALRKEHQNLNILHFDAHPDLYDNLEGKQDSHACPFARIMEEGLVERLVQVGIRTANGHQREQAERFGVEMIEMKDWQPGIELCFTGPLYISFDLDALDPAHAPGVSHFEPGGFSTGEAIEMIQGIKAPGFIGADIVEYNPTRDLNGMTAAVCAKLIKEIAARLFED